jgi:lipoprotein-anchoring transpeptidase ErfK/SrfK
MTPASSVIRILSTMRRALVLLAVLGAVGVPFAYAQEGTTTGGTTTGTTTTSEEPPPPPVVPANVTIAGVAVGGMTAGEAITSLRGFFARPFTFTFRGHRRTSLPLRVGATADVRGAVARALAAAPGEAVGLTVRISRAKLRTYVARLARAWSRPAVDSTVRLRDLRPFVTRSHRGYRIKRFATRVRIRRALAAHERGPLAVPYRVLRPDVTRENFGPVIVIRRGSHALYLYSGARYQRYFGVAVGMPQYPTPLGRFYIAVKQRNPWWYPPDAAWAAGASPIPPGPGNPLGTRWMGLSWGGVGIHGTPDSASIGYSASHGCIRMRIPEAEWLFEHVRVGTTVFIVSA